MKVQILICIIFLSVTKADEVFLIFYPGPTQANSVRYTIHNFGEIYDHPAFEKTRGTTVFSYGNLQTLSHPYVQEIINSYLEISDLFLNNFIAVDYSQSWILDGGVQRLGDQLGIALINLFNRGYPAIWTHLIGFGTAAHIVSVASHHAFRFNEIIHRVTGLSPTRTSNSIQISPNSASYVDVIHTNTAFHGNLNSQGLATFYVNGGAQQPWCGNDHACSHDSAMKLYAESVNTTVFKFPSLFCNSWENFCRGSCNDNFWTFMGIWTQQQRGFFFLQTNNYSPFSRNDHRPSGC